MKMQDFACAHAGTKQGAGNCLCCCHFSLPALPMPQGGVRVQRVQSGRSFQLPTQHSSFWVKVVLALHPGNRSSSGVELHQKLFPHCFSFSRFSVLPQLPPLPNRCSSQLHGSSGHPERAPQPTLGLFWPTAWKRLSVPALGSPFQCLTTILVRKLFLNASLNFPCYNLRLISCLVAMGNNPSTTSL